MTIVVGLDVGAKGGIVALLGRQVLLADRIPTRRVGRRRQADGSRLAELYRRLQVHGLPIVTYHERVFAPQRGNGAISLGMEAGIAIDRALDFGEVHQIEAKVWQRHLCCNHKDRDQRKQQAIDRVKRHWPQINLSPGRYTTPQSGIADAACIAEYGQAVELGTVLRLAKRSKPKTIKRRQGA